jgi:hypothetical protein
MVVETKEGFLKFISQIGWVGNEFVDFRICCDGCQERFGFITMDIVHLTILSQKVGLHDEVIVLLAKKVFNYIARSLSDETGCDNIDPVDMKSEMVDFISCTF